MNISSKKEVTVYKDDRGIYKISQKGRKLNEETQEFEDDWQKVIANFQPKVELKNETKIKIKDGYDSHYVIKTQWTYDDGKSVYMRMPKYIIKDFEVVKEGIDEVYSSKPKKSVENNSDVNEMNEFYPDTYSDDFSDLPF